ncbi:MAG: hypothetical protein IKD96_01580 [Oscillospiraceae bacterium]|nr:hypothetical protein [Oscillospiraceae bacterium]
MKKLLVLLLAALMLISLSACGTAAQTVLYKPPDPADVESYADVYELYDAIVGDIWEVVLEGTQIHNEGLTYGEDEDFFTLLYIPFYTTAPSIGEYFADNTMQQARSHVRWFYGENDLYILGDGQYKSEYTVTTGEGDDAVEHPALTVWDYDEPNCSMNAVVTVDDDVTEFTQFVSQGNDTYLIYTMEDLALVTWVEGTVTALYHTHRDADHPFTLDDHDFFPDGTITKEEILGDPDNEYTITLEKHKLTYTGADGETWTETIPVD